MIIGTFSTQGFRAPGFRVPARRWVSGSFMESQLEARFQVVSQHAARRLGSVEACWVLRCWAGSFPVSASHGNSLWKLLRSCIGPIACAKANLSPCARDLSWDANHWDRGGVRDPSVDGSARVPSQTSVHQYFVHKRGFHGRGSRLAPGRWGSFPEKARTAVRTTPNRNRN